MKRNELHVGDRVAHVTQSYGSTNVREVIVLSVERWEKAYSHSRTSEITVDGTTYGVRGYKASHHGSLDGANGVLVGYGSVAYVAQLRQLQPLEQAKQEEADRNAAAKADWTRRREQQDAWEERLVAVLDALGIERDKVNRQSNVIHIDIEELEALAARVKEVPAA